MVGKWCLEARITSGLKLRPRTNILHTIPSRLPEFERRKKSEDAGKKLRHRTFTDCAQVISGSDITFWGFAYNILDVYI